MSTTILDADISKIATAVSNTWDIIGEDHLAACEASGEEATNRLAISSCLDHLDVYGGDATAQPLLRQLIKSHSYHTVLVELNEKCALV